jgi:hypothetical protein
MNRFKSILVYVNADSVEQGQALSRAVELAERDDAKRSVIASVETAPHIAERLIPGVADRPREERVFGDGSTT